VQKLQSIIEENLPFTTGIGIAIAIPQSVQTQKVVFNTLVYSVYGFLQFINNERGRLVVYHNGGLLLLSSIAVNGITTHTTVYITPLSLVRYFQCIAVCTLCFSCLFAFMLYFKYFTVIATCNNYFY
jgi:hypothetical protein